MQEIRMGAGNQFSYNLLWFVAVGAAISGITLRDPIFGVIAVVAAGSLYVGSCIKETAMAATEQRGRLHYEIKHGEDY